jgi:hypothetical protein
LFERTESNNKQGESLFGDRNSASARRSDAIAHVTLELAAVSGGTAIDILQVRDVIDNQGI